jgi:4-deoxy-L-threo-5-hexosulose-uronate ketol-isomerase
MYRNTLQATHPSMMVGASAQALRDRYLLSGLFASGAVTLDYLHYERFVVGGAMPTVAPVELPSLGAPTPGEPFLARRELGVVNVGGAGRVTADRASGTASYGFVWAMGGENLDYTDMQVLDICQLR